MSPILFNLFVDPIINHIQSLLRKHKFNDLFSFIDDIALQTTFHATLHKVLHFLFVQGPRYGLSFNTTKSELHALNNATHITIRVSPTQHFSTFTDDGNPRVFYKYLGTYFFNKQQKPKHAPTSTQHHSRLFRQHIHPPSHTQRNHKTIQHTTDTYPHLPINLQLTPAL